MPRKFNSTAHLLRPDPRHQSLLVSKFINAVMLDGKKSTAQKAVYGAFDIVTNRLKDKDPVEVFTTAIGNVRPLIMVRSKRVGGATYQVPVEVRASRRNTLAMRWLIEAAQKRGEKTMAQKLAGELLDASENKGTAVKKREDTHRMAEANKAFAHYRW